MITKFTTVYAGHVDLPDRGQEATPANERRYSNQHLASVFEKTEAIAKQMDALGYETLWLAEHHFQHEGYECIPNILMLAVHLAHVTKRLKIGCGFNIVPMWHPLRLAEDFAAADILTGGRTVFGVGRGYHTREVETFGGPMLDGEANREVFEEGVEIIFKAFNDESFSHQGAHYTLPPRVPYRGYELEKLTLVPRPIHLPVECWQPIVSASPRGLDFMVRHGIKGAVGGGAATMQGGPIIAYQRGGGARRQGSAARRGFAARPAFPSRPHPRAGGPRDQADLRGACEDVRAVGVCAGADPGAGRRGRAARRLGQGRRADCRAFHEIGLVVRRDPGRAHRIAEGLRRALSRHAAHQPVAARSAPRRRPCSNSSNGSPRRSCRRSGPGGAEFGRRAPGSGRDCFGACRRLAMTTASCHCEQSEAIPVGPST